MASLFKFKLLKGSHSYVLKGEKKYLTAGDPRNDTLVSHLQLDQLFKNKFYCLGPCDAEGNVVDSDTSDPTNISGLPPGREVSNEFAGAEDKGIRVFFVEGALSRGGGAYAYVDNEGNLSRLNDKGLSHSKMQDLVGNYAPPAPSK